jgi:hypothetical protein
MSGNKNWRVHRSGSHSFLAIKKEGIGRITGGLKIPFLKMGENTRNRIGKLLLAKGLRCLFSKSL